MLSTLSGTTLRRTPGNDISPPQHDLRFRCSRRAGQEGLLGQGRAGVADPRLPTAHAARAAYAARTGSCLAACTPTTSLPRATAEGRQPRGLLGVDSPTSGDR